MMNIVLFFVLTVFIGHVNADVYAWAKISRTPSL
jgi:hypothetical protein